MTRASERLLLSIQQLNASRTTQRKGHHLFRSLLTLRDGEGFLIVYSITNRSTFEKIERIIERVHRVKDVDLPYAISPTSPYGHGPTSPMSAHSPYGSISQSSSAGGGAGRAGRIPITVVGNKRDQVALREVSTDEARYLCQRLGVDFFEASAKTNTNVEAAFKSLVRQIKTGRRGAEGGGGAVGGGRKKRKCVIL